LYVANLTTNPAQVQLLVGLSSLRADWCSNRSNGGLTTGPIAFSNDDGIYVLSGTTLTPLPNTAGMVYPAWYPNCQYLAVDVGQNPQVRGEHVTALINATTGVVVAAPLADNKVWAGFPSVNQADPKLVAFAGQFIGNSNYYDQDINYAWVTDRSRLPPIVVPLDRMAPAGPGFLQQFQARAGWWSPDGKWFAFESNRSCDEIDGLTYAIFIQPADGAQAAAGSFKSGPPMPIQVIGHTDTSGLPAYNQKLSEQRAQNVAGALVVQGVPQNALTVTGVGENDLKVPTPPGVREPQNRRVEIVEGGAPPPPPPAAQ
jgi:hypothetical protein